MTGSVEVQRRLINVAQSLESKQVDDPQIKTLLAEGAESCRQAKTYIEQQTDVHQVLQRLREVLDGKPATESDLLEIQRVADLKRQRRQVVYSSQNVIDD